MLYQGISPVDVCVCIRGLGLSYIVSAANRAAVVVVYSSKAEVTYDTNKYVSSNASEYKFAFTTIFSEAYENSTYYNADFCYRGFVALTKDGVTDIIYVDADGALLGSEISLYEIVSYFISGAYQGEKAEEYASLPKFHEVVDAVEIREYFPKDSFSQDKLLSDGETLLVEKNFWYNFTVDVEISQLCLLMQSSGWILTPQTTSSG